MTENDPDIGEVDPYFESALAEDEIEAQEDNEPPLPGMSRVSWANYAGIAAYALVYPILSFRVGYVANGMDSAGTTFELIELYCFVPGLIFGSVTLLCFRAASRLFKSVTYSVVGSLLIATAINSALAPFTAWGMLKLFVPNFRFWHHLPVLPTISDILLAWLLPLGFVIAGAVLLGIDALGQMPRKKGV